MADVTVDYAKFDKSGLKSLLSYLKKEGTPVADVDAPNVQKREAGYPVKTATLSFDDGQTLVLKIKSDGGLYQAKLNGKVLAIKKYHEASTFMEEVARYVKDNSEAYKKGREKAAARAAKEAIRQIKPASSTIAEQITQVESAVSEMTGANEEIQRKVAETGVGELEAQLAILNAQLKDEEKTGADLQAQIDELKSKGFVTEAAKKFKGPFEFIIDAEERGEFAAHVEDSTGKIVADWNKEDCDDAGGFPPVEDGFMRNIRDMAGLEGMLGISPIKYVG